MHALITRLIMHWSPGWSCTDHTWSYTDHETAHALITWLHMHWSQGWSCTDHVAIMLWSHGSAYTDHDVDYQANEQAGVTRLSWPQSSRWTGRCRAAQLLIMKQMITRILQWVVISFSTLSFKPTKFSCWLVSGFVSFVLLSLPPSSEHASRSYHFKTHQ